MALDYSTLSATEYLGLKFQYPGCENPFNVSSDFLLECLANYFTARLATTEKGSLKIIDYGCGPVLINLASVAPKASEIVLADYMESYRIFVKEWLDRDPAAYDWSAYFKHVVQTLEGKAEQEVLLRQEEVRRKVKAIVPCDITQDRIIAEGYEGPYDVVMSFKCLDAACSSLQSYKEGVTKLVSLLKEGGHLLLYTSKRENCEVGYYKMNDRLFKDALPLSEDFVTKALQQSGLTHIHSEFKPVTPSAISNVQGFFFFTARKM